MDIISELESKIASVLDNCPPDTIFIAAVSGGADSMAMLNALCSFSRRSAADSRLSIRSRLHVLHIEHGLRSEEESLGDAEFVRAFCREQKIKCRVKHIPPGKVAVCAKRKGIGIEAAARFFRHKAFRVESARLKQGAGLTGNEANVFILTAHTKDDLLETSLMRVLRGSGPSGLAGIAGNREQLSESNEQGKERIGIEIIRPLISFYREDVIAYLKARGVSWREDATNKDEKFLRNRIRRRLVPLLDEAFPSWKTGVAAMAETQALASDFIADEARRRIIWMRDLKSSLSTDADNFFSQPLIIREEAVFQAIDELLKNVKNPRSVKRVVVRRFCADCGMKAADFGAVTARREEGRILLLRKRKEYFEYGVSELVRQQD